MQIVPGGIAAKSDSLRIGDRILEVCGEDVTKSTHQEAVLTLLQPGNSITLLVQHDPLPEGFQVGAQFYFLPIIIVLIILWVGASQASIKKINIIHSFPKFEKTIMPTVTLETNNFFFHSPSCKFEAYCLPFQSFFSKLTDLEYVPSMVSSSLWVF